MIALQQRMARVVQKMLALLAGPFDSAQGRQPRRLSPHESGNSLLGLCDWCYSAISRFSANGHCSSIHCASQRKPAMRAMENTSSGEYLWLLSVQIVSLSRNSTTSSAAGIWTV